MLEVKNLAKSFGGVKATNDVSLNFPDGSLSAVIGPNGAGKTTFFNLISGRIRPDEGQVMFEGTDLVGLPSHEVARRGIVRAFQVASLFPSLTVRASLEAALTSHQGHTWRMFSRFPTRDATRSADEIIETLGLQKRAHHPSGTLSHGDQKLLDMGLALALQPKVLLLDEPTAGMGPDERWKMIDKIHALWAAEKLTIVFIEHDMDIVFKISQTVAVLRYGTLLAQGTPEEIRLNPDVVEAYLGTVAVSSSETERA
ncbi:ABC transporter ATP-binding protein [Paraburkholderia caribensis]|uniref:ABC transporter ATP-binding protein n=1 Tax=Paraburkholderia caribensis TaxID=75105 RepID=UPI00078C86B0|nr:ABC transporter ATP-binding protein [Paraburkholderia caribensis]AMV48325.1 ABC transporter ATP-binding protein [Paraburkholderia caribensis]